MIPDEQQKASVRRDQNLDDLKVLNRYERELREAEEDARTAYARVEALRGVTQNLRRLLGMPQTQGEPRSASPAEIAYIQADNLARVERQRVDKAARRPEIVMRAVPRTEYVALPGEKPTPRGRDAVRRILIESRRTMHADEMVEEAHARGWMRDVKDPWNALSAAAKRLVSDGEVESRGRARYRYRLDKLPPPEEDKPSSGTPDDSAEPSADGQGRLLAGGGGDT